MADATAKIYKAIPAIMNELEAIGRERRNQAQGFNYRGIDDLYNALQPLLAKHGVFTAPMVLEERRTDKPTKSGGMQTHVVLKVQYRFYADDGSYFDTALIGEGMDSGDKASNKAESVAHKYALTQVFAVRTQDEQDPDGQTPEPTAARPQQSPSQQFQRHGKPTTATGHGDWQKKPATQKQVGMLKGLWEELLKAELEPAPWQSFLMESFGKKSAKDLTGGEASQLIENFKKILNSKPEVGSDDDIRRAAEGN
jgi:hypothetical protein